MKFVLGYIPIFDAKISAMNNKVDETSSNPIWGFSRTVTFKTLITQHQDQFPLKHMAKMIRYPFNKEIVYQIHVRYITNTYL